jgi:hypothetical protein
MKKKPVDRHLDTPSEANRDKHINFTALDKNDNDPADAPATGKLADTDENNKKETGREQERSDEEAF